jgi:2-phospho-L-lactate guanylyltransferase
MITAPDERWRVVVPVKGRLSAKSRLHPPAGVRRSDLAHAFALDTLAAVSAGIAPAHLAVVTSDEATIGFAAALGAATVPDSRDGLNAAVAAGISHVLRTLGDGPTAVLLGDLPSLVPAELLTALAECTRHERCFVPDADGTGTVLLAARSALLLEPRFGAGSAEAHGRDSVRLDLDLPTLRSDVDDDASLREAARLGVGRHTSAVLLGAPTSL